MTVSSTKSEESWDRARWIAHTLKVMPDRVVQAIRLLRSEHNENAGADSIAALKENTVKALGLIDKVTGLKAPLYFAASELFPDSFKTSEDNTSKALVSILGPGLFASLLLVVWYYRRAGKLCQPLLWEPLSKDYMASMELGYWAGKAVPRIGSDIGVLIGGVRYAALGALAMKDADLFQRYLNARRGNIDLVFEESKWGCDHTQVAFHLLQGYGPSAWISGSDAGAFSPQAMSAAFAGSEEGMGEYPAAKLWSGIIATVDSFRSKKNNIQRLSECDCDAADLEVFKRKAADVVASGSSFTWIRRGAIEDLPA